MSAAAVNPMKAGLEDVVVVSPSDICCNNRLIRPRSDYTGPTDEKYVPLAQR